MSLQVNESSKILIVSELYDLGQVAQMSATFLRRTELLGPSCEHYLQNF